MSSRCHLAHYIYILIYQPTGLNGGPDGKAVQVIGNQFSEYGSISLLHNIHYELCSGVCFAATSSIVLTTQPRVG